MIKELSKNNFSKFYCALDGERQNKQIKYSCLIPKKTFYKFVLSFIVSMTVFFSPILGLSFEKELPIMLDVLDLKKMDVLDVLKLISQKSGMNIIAGKDVKGRVTVFLKNIEVNEALKIIIEAYGWALVREEGVIKVMTAKAYEIKYGYKFGQDMETRIIQLTHANVADLVAVLNQMKSGSGKVIFDEKSNSLILTDIREKIKAMEAIVKRIDVPLETKIFELSYADAEGFSGKIAEVLTPGVGTSRFDKRLNTIIISDTRNKLEEISEIVMAFDHKDREVLIEAKIIQIVLSDEHKMGIDWEAILTDFHSMKLTNDFDILGATDKRGTLSVGTISNDDYTVLIEALDTVGITDILSSPRITVVNNKEAKILVGSNEPYVTSSTTTPASGSTTTAETVNFIEVGVKLFVTPTIHKDDFITMKIKPEVSSKVGEVETSNNNRIPVVGTSEAETIVFVKNGVTIIIGGLIEKKKSKTRKSIPLLGDIPFVGVVFRNKISKVDKTELVIFLTPTIITGDVDESEKQPFSEF